MSQRPSPAPDQQRLDGGRCRVPSAKAQGPPASYVVSFQDPVMPPVGAPTSGVGVGALAEQGCPEQGRGGATTRSCFAPKARPGFIFGLVFAEGREVGGGLVWASASAGQLGCVSWFPGPLVRGEGWGQWSFRAQPSTPLAGPLAAPLLRGGGPSGAAVPTRDQPSGPEEISPKSPKTAVPLAHPGRPWEGVPREASTKVRTLSLGRVKGQRT